ncbi:MAG TPA: radical SAM protein [Polyangia bacterium]|nr:radical SAM protein [Polyangia bacterium]
MRVLLLTPPMVQLNTPYPATAYLTGFLRQHAAEFDLEIQQADPALELFLAIFCREGLARVRASLRKRIGRSKGAAAAVPRPVASFVTQATRYLKTIDPVIRFLQGRDPGLAEKIAERGYLPEGPRFEALLDALGESDGRQDGGDHFDGAAAAAHPLARAFAALSVADRAKHLASLYVDDLADAIRGGIDPRFELSRYGEKLASSAASFDPLQEALDGPATLVDEILDGISVALLVRHRPDLVGVTVPFPGNLYGAFRIARAIKKASPGVRLVLGGGYVNTELRELREPRVFDHFDYVTLDDGERPLLSLLAHLAAPATAPRPPLFRTYLREGGAIVFRTDPAEHDIPHRLTGTPTYDGLPLGSYVSLFEMLNPMHRLWSDGRWNKLTLAHGCYWKKCSFCDVSLDYIGRYEVAPADLLVDRIVALCQETGQTGFHFVDEAAPPATLRALAERLIERRVAITWWGNIRFEKTFTPTLARLLARSGCIAVTGGLEVASNRLLARMEKGVTVEQVARVTRAFTDAGVMVHAYLMYGFPTETEQETVDALERVRQLFVAGCIQSAFWHRFAATVHSPIGMAPKRFGIRLLPQASTFARNEIPFQDPVGTDHDFLGRGLRKALYNYMHGVGLELDVRSWFTEPPARSRSAAGKRRPKPGRRGPARPRRVPMPQVPHDLISNALREV